MECLYCIPGFLGSLSWPSCSTLSDHWSLRKGAYEAKWGMRYVMPVLQSQFPWLYLVTLLDLIKVWLSLQRVYCLACLAIKLCTKATCKTHQPQKRQEERKPRYCPGHFDSARGTYAPTALISVELSCSFYREMWEAIRDNRCKVLTVSKAWLNIGHKVKGFW